MKIKLERCLKCMDSKAILKEIYFYGKVSYICKDCNNLMVTLRVRTGERGLNGVPFRPGLLLDEK